MSKKTKISLSRLESFLKAQCDRLRTSMDAAEYKNYIIALLFLKRINDQFEIDRIALKDELKKQYPIADDSDIEAELEVPVKYGCYVPEKARWKFVLNPINDDGEGISYADAITTALTEMEIPIFSNGFGGGQRFTLSLRSLQPFTVSDSAVPS